MGLTRRQFTGMLGTATALPASITAVEEAPAFRIRTITAGLPLGETPDFGAAKDAVRFLRRTRARFLNSGYEVQTLRLATQALPHWLPGFSSSTGIKTLEKLDRFATDNDVMLSIGPVLLEDENPDGIADWALELVDRTSAISFSMNIASREKGIHYQSVEAAAQVMSALSTHGVGGESNFRFAATAFCPPGTPFFPAAWFNKSRSFSIGLESPRLLKRLVSAAESRRDISAVMREGLDAAIAPIASSAADMGAHQRWQYLGIDTSPAPGLDASIGEVIEAITGQPFGAPSTLSACAAITTALQSLQTARCGYSGLMLPMLEDRTLAQRADEGRYGLSQLLLYSSVCGTGLDAAPLPGDTPVAKTARIITDVAALATRYNKALSARLLPIPGKQAGETVDFKNPYLTTAKVLSAES